MHPNLKRFAIKSAVLIGALLAVIFLFRFPIDYFGLSLLRMNEATRLFSKSDALKVVALAALFFSLYYQERIAKVRHERLQPLTTALLVAGGLLASGMYYFLRYLANARHITQGPGLYLVMAASLLTLGVSFACFALGVFSPGYVGRFWRAFKKEIIITSSLTIIGYVLLMAFQNLWPVFSYTIARLLYGMLSPFYPTYMELSKEPLLDVDGFTVIIGAPCSGIESLFLFVAFSLGIYALDHRRLKKGLFLAASLVGLAGIYFVNVLRLYLLILTGIYINPQFAVGMFHTNVGWLLFVIYFLIYYYVITKFIYVSRSPRKK